MARFSFSRLDFLCTCVGLVLLLADIVLDIIAAVSFYQDEDYVCLGILLLFLVGSSVLVQVYSWLWYSYQDFDRVTKVESCLSMGQLKLLHFFQLGIYFRHAGVVEMSARSFISRDPDHKGCAAFLSHDLSMLRLIETFSESAPQLVLMVTIMLQWGKLDPITVLKALASTLAVAFSVTMYHRSLRAFLPDRVQQRPLSSAVYYLWNLLVILSRLTALALFASVLPCFIFTHFLCSWLVFFFSAWRSGTDFMESPVGEWIYRATVGLIWYFSWFSVVDGRTRNKALLYHGYILLDIILLCGLWCWKMSTEPPFFIIPVLNAIITAVCVVSIYIVGLVIKIVYYRHLHPNLSKDELKVKSGEDVVDSARMDGEVAARSLPAPTVELYNKRMRKLAESFYT
ncbi:XK-related protein 8-like [Aulostomus maculatus]